MIDLWPDQFGQLGSPPPLLTLKEQASIISSKTGGRIVAEVSSGRQFISRGDGFTHIFFLVAPFLDDYKYQLFSVTHDVGLYPLKVEADVMDRAFSCESPEEFQAALRTIFASPQTIKVIQAILAQTDAVRS
jgi:hypothetical protein